MAIAKYVKTRAPKKPHSARRMCMRANVIRPRKGGRDRPRRLKGVFCYVPGIGHNLQPYSRVLMRGGRRRDIPGMRYTAIRGKEDFAPVVGRRSSRSKYGIKRGR